MEFEHFDSKADLLDYVLNILNIYSFHFDYDEDEFIEAAAYLEHLAEKGDKE